MSAKKVAVVTGGTTGIGKATVELLRSRGLTALSLSRREGLDVSNPASVNDSFGLILKKYGRIDVLVNSAAVPHVADPLDIPAAEWDRVLRVNVTGSYLCANAVLPGMKKRGWGRIVNVSSIAGRAKSKSASVVYTASKAALIGLTRQLAASFAGDGITVNCVCPSQTETEMLASATTAAQRKALAAQIPIGRLAEPSEVAEAIAFLASEGASYVTGACLDVNGGQL